MARPYQGKPAGVVSRLLAGGVDILVVLVIMAATYISWIAVRFLLRHTEFEFPQPTLMLILTAGLVTAVCYLTLGWTMTGRTYGDHLMGLRVVVDRSGTTMHLPLSVLRAVLCALFPIGLIWAAFNAHSRSVQDILVRTSVRYDWHTQEVDGGRSLGETSVTSPPDAPRSTSRVTRGSWQSRVSKWSARQSLGSVEVKSNSDPRGDDRVELGLHQVVVGQQQIEEPGLDTACVTGAGR